MHQIHSAFSRRCTPGPAAAAAAAVEGALNELLEGFAGQKFCDEVTRLPDGVEDAHSGRDDQDDEGEHHIEAEVAQTACQDQVSVAAKGIPLEWRA